MARQVRRAGRMPYADDLVILVSKWNPELTNWVESRLEGKFGLEINREKTRVVEVKRGGESLDFLGYTFRWDRDLKGRPQPYLNVFPSAKAVAREREKLREMTHVSQSHTPVPQLIGRLNRHLKGWANYFSFGYPRRLVGYRLVRGLPFDGTFGTAQSTTVPTAGRSQMA